MKLKSMARWAGIYLLVIALCLSGSILTDKSVTVIAEGSPIDNRYCVVIDAGHGGEDSGAISCTGVYESALNLQIAIKLDDLMHLLGIKTVMMRSTDEDLSTAGETIASRKMSDLKERVRIANATENGVLISIHQNNFQDSRYSGAQVFYAKTEGSKAFAESMQQAFKVNLNPGSRRGIKYADGVYLMEHLTCPGLLVECGFLSNPEEEGKLRSNTYQNKLCCVIATTASQYLNT